MEVGLFVVCVYLERIEVLYYFFMYKNTRFSNNALFIFTNLVLVLVNNIQDETFFRPTY